MKPLVYIAGPYTHPDPIANARTAVHAGMQLWEHGYTPLIPHLSLFARFVHPMNVPDLYTLDIELLRRCDGVLRIPGPSAGADLEVKFAENNSIPVFMFMDKLLDHFKSVPTGKEG